MGIRGRSKWLADMINARGFKHGAEVGVGTGLTTKYVLLNCRKLTGYIVADDWRAVPGSRIFEGSNMKETFDEQFKYNKKVRVLEGVSWEVAEYVLNESLDFVFIDASHDYDSVLKDLKAWVPKVKLGGLISGHDEHWPGVRRALNEILPGYKKAGIDNVWFITKK